jgi:hypothetical protein
LKSPGRFGEERNLLPLLRIDPRFLCRTKHSLEFKLYSNYAIAFIKWR